MCAVCLFLQGQFSFLFNTLPKMFPGKHWPLVWAIEQHLWYLSFTVCIHHRQEHTVKCWSVTRWGRAPFLLCALWTLWRIEQAALQIFFFFHFFSLSLLSGIIRRNTSRTDCQPFKPMPEKRQTLWFLPTLVLFFNGQGNYLISEVAFFQPQLFRITLVSERNCS